MRRLVYLVPLLAGLVGAQSNDAWKVIGPGGGGAQFFPAISPHDARDVLVASDMSGSYLTQDGGASWRMFNLRGVSKAFAWDPRDARVMYAAGAGLYRSADRGRSWSLIYPSPSRVSGIDSRDDHADERFLVDGQAVDPITTLAVDPDHSKVLYAAIGGAVRISQDAGTSWRTEHEFPAAVRHVWAEGGKLYVAVDRSIWVREKGDWRQGEASSAAWTDIAGAPPVFYAVSPNGATVSEDGGKSWRAAALAGAGGRLTAVAASLHHPDIAYVGYARLNVDGQTRSGVAKTADRGKTWRLVWKQGPEGAPNEHDAWIAPALGATWGGPPLNLAVAPNNPDICYATDLGRTMRTTDGGQTWDAVYARPAAHGWTSTGLNVTTDYGVHFDPFDPRRIFITYTDIGLFRSEDAGQSWESSIAGIPRAWRNTTYWMVFDPEVRGRAWAVVSATHDLPRPKMWRTQPPARYRGGVVRSDDGGRTWSTASQGMEETAATHILLDARSPQDARVLYVAAFGRGVYKSVDGGAHWALKNAGIEGSEPFAWRLAQDPAGKLYLVVARRSEDGSIGNANDGALYESTDAADHWKRIRLPEGVNGPNGITIDTRDPRRLYLAAWRRRTDSADGGGGIYLSENAGETWRRIFSRDQHVYDVTFDARDGALYACGFESSAWRSTDRGEHWQRIAGYDFKWGHRVAPDPANARLVYITTFGGSVWHGPAAGDGHEREDIRGPWAAGH